MLCDYLRHPEITYLYIPLMNQYILRLDIPMNNTMLLKKLQRDNHLRNKPLQYALL